MIDLQLVRHNRITAREYNRMWEHVLALFTLQGSRLTSEALRILVNVKGIGEADLIARRADMQSPLRVATKVVNVLLKMETTRRAFSRTIQAFARIRQ
ncbi:uncharacterized protein LOC127867254 isoform X2 [Dreissena polymorpha]|nr:uncharacterized protein LOC127867254 isoform X2 [Dreissena polymorpha]